MRTFWNINRTVSTLKEWNPNCWIQITCPNEEDEKYLLEDLKIPDYFLDDVKDKDERARYDFDEGWVLIILRIPYVKEMGLVYYDWNVSSGDGAVISSDGVYQRVTEGVANNDVSVVLMHDGSGHEETVKALPRILDKLIEMNCVILPITQSTDPVQASL